MRLITEIPAGYSPQAFRFLAAQMIEGLAKGVSPSFFGPGKLPPLYRSGIVYKSDPHHGSGVEHFVLPETVYARGWGDCDQLCIYRIAELLADGTPARCSIADYEGLGNMHAQVRLPTGQIEDPSILLGAENQWPEKFLYDL